jgi:transcriptional regulator of arginine metabolism
LTGAVNIYTLECIFILMSKLTRQQLIRQVVEEKPVPSQDDLRRALKKQGMSVTQATLSRDMRELGIYKTSEGYALPQNGHGIEAVVPSAARLIREFVLEIREAQNLLVVKTSVGSAQPVAAALDAEGWPEMVGSLGGDDTILIICTTKKSAAKLADRIREMLA